MPTEEQVKNSRSLRRPSWKDSRDYRGSNFLDYVSPSFYREDDTKLETFLKWDTLRANNELIAINEPTLTTALQLAPKKLVSPDMPVGIYKAGAEAKLYFWIDGKQITARYKLVSFSRGNIETLSEQTGKALLETFLGKYSELAREASIFGIGEKLADVADYLRDQLELDDVFGFWLLVQTVTVDIATVTESNYGKSALETYCEQNPNDSICKTAKNSKLPIGLLLAGAGLITGNLWLSGVALLLRFRGQAKEETKTELPKRQMGAFNGTR